MTNPTANNNFFGTPDPNIEISMLRGMVDELTQQVSDLSRLLIATVSTIGGNVEIPRTVVESLDSHDNINVEPNEATQTLKLFVTRTD